MRGDRAQLHLVHGPSGIAVVTALSEINTDRSSDAIIVLAWMCPARGTTARAPCQRFRSTAWLEADWCGQRRRRRPDCGDDHRRPPAAKDCRSAASCVPRAIRTLLRPGRIHGARQMAAVTRSSRRQAKRRAAALIAALCAAGSHMPSHRNRCCSRTNAIYATRIVEPKRAPPTSMWRRSIEAGRTPSRRSLRRCAKARTAAAPGTCRRIRKSRAPTR